MWCVEERETDVTVGGGAGEGGGGGGVFFFNDTATTEIYTLSLHDALPISISRCDSAPLFFCPILEAPAPHLFILTNLRCGSADRKSTRLNSSHVKRSRMPSSA